MIINILDNTLDVGQALRELFPEADYTKDYVLSDDEESARVEWNLLEPFPTDEELRTASLEFIKKEKIVDLSAECENRILNGFVSETTGYIYGFSQYDQMNMTQQMLLMVDDHTATSVDWKTEDAGVITHDKATFYGVVKEAEDHKRNHISHYWQLKSLVESCTSEEAVGAVVWDSV